MTIDEKIKELYEIKKLLQEARVRYNEIEGLADNRVMGSIRTAIMDINFEINRLEEPIVF